MKSMYRVLLIGGLIIGCFIRLPVRMLPASVGDQGDFGEMVQYPYVNKLAELNIVKGVGVPETDNRSSARIEHDPTVRLQSELLIAKHSAALKSFTESDVPASLAGHPGFNKSPAPSGINSDINSHPVKAAHLTDNRAPSEELVSTRLNRVSDRLVNISKNLDTLKSISRNNTPSKKIHGGKTLIALEQSDSKHIGVKIAQDNIRSNQNIDKKTQTSRNINGDSDRGKTHEQHLPTVVDGIYWSTKVDSCPDGFSNDDVKQWRHNVRHLHVVKVETGCGSMENRLITFNDSSKACVRYRLNTDLMQGDIYSYYLGHLLGIKHTPPTALVMADRESRTWRRVADAITDARWTDRKPVILSKWIDHLTPVYAPGKLRDQKEQLNPSLVKGETDLSEMCSLAQWSDLIVHDYLAANLDRVVNNVYNLRWNPAMMRKPIHNLEQTPATGQFVFLDNESGLFHGYRLLDTFGPYHRTLLDSICVFRKRTVEKIEKLYLDGNIGDQLMNLYRQGEEFHSLLPRIPNKNMDILQRRLEDVYKQIVKCRHLYSGL